MKKISTAIFEPYLYEKDSIRPALEKPFSYEDCIVASDARILLMVRKDLIEGELELSKNPPDLSKFMPKPNCNLILTGKQISSALDSLDKEEETEEVEPETECPECDGDGEVEWEYYDRDNHAHTRYLDCPCCNGSGILREAVTRPTGRMRVKASAAIVINGVNFRADHLQTLHDTMVSLEIGETTIVSLDKEKPCMFRISDGIHFIVMPFGSLTTASSAYHLSLMPGIR